MELSVFATLTHELRTPLNGVVGMLDLLAQTRVDERQSDYLRLARTACDTLLSLVDDVLNYSRAESGAVEIERREFDLRASLKEAIQLLQPLATARGVRLALHFAAGMPTRVIADSLRLRQVLNNLVSNAIHFTPAGGEVAVHVEPATRDDASSSRSHRISVRDTGIGLSPEAIQRIFRPFAQAEASTARHYGGTGLGLAISKGLVELMGGTIGVDSTVGRGTTFWFTVDLQTPADIAPMPIVPAAASSARRAIVVDAQPLDGFLATAYLGEAGFDATHVESADDAIACMRRSTFALALLDLETLGDKWRSVAEAVQRAAAEGNESSRPIVIALVAADGSTDSTNAAGPYERLPKPLDCKQLIATLDRFVPRTPAADGPTPSGTLAFLANAGLLQRVYERFEIQLAADVPTIARSVHGGDVDAVRRTAHGLSGAARYIDAHAIADVARNLERWGQATSSPLAEADALVRSLEGLARTWTTRFGSPFGDAARGAA